MHTNLMNLNFTIAAPVWRDFKRSTLTLAALAALGVLGALQGCASAPPRNAALDMASERYTAAQGQSQVATLAPDELKRASDALRMAEQAQRNGDSIAQVDHLAYLASQQTVIAQDAAAGRAAQAVVAGAAAERDRMRLAQRTQEADNAQRALVTAEQGNARTQAQLANAQTAQARTSAELALSAAAVQAQATQAQADKDKLAKRDQELAELQAQLKELNARQTERGLIVTLGDVLFDTGSSQLKGNGAVTMAKLADFMKRYPQRTAAIEGYTDSVGSSDSNRDLAGRRAGTVRDALQQLGVAGGRLSTRALGEDNPVADNGTAAGRQMNRRVEVVFSTAAGDLSMK